MNILAIDIGTYSIKFLEIKPERKSLTLIEKNEVIIEEAKPHYPNIQNLKELQKEIVANYIQKKSNETRIIFQIPNELITTRYMEIPGTSKRKTEQIIPFQLDENLPYSLNQAHFSSRMIKRATGFSVISNITQLSVFKDFLSFFENKDAQPTSLTSEISTIQSYIDSVRLNDSCCILDIGHKTTKAYFIQDRKVVANHTSYIAGAQLNEVISKTYQISLDDAILYKHENAFFLTDEQFAEVNNEQREFGLLMRQIFASLLSEFRRWEIGHRVKYGTPITKIYLIGGTTLINGLDQFIEYHTGLSISGLAPINDIKNDYLPHDKSFFMVKMMAIAERNPNNIVNFLTGKFQNASNAFISLHSAIFIWVRSSFIAILILIGLLAERYIVLINNEKVIDAKITKTISASPILMAEIPKAARKDFKLKPKPLLDSLKMRNNIVKDEVRSILSSNSLNALKPLAILSRTIAANPKINLVNFSTDGHKVTARFQAEIVEDLKGIEQHMKSSGLADLNVKLYEDKKELNITFLDKE
jgi:Tfp pilus assembly PilM family ATPase